MRLGSSERDQCAANPVRSRVACGAPQLRRDGRSRKQAQVEQAPSLGALDRRGNLNHLGRFAGAQGIESLEARLGVVSCAVNHGNGRGHQRIDLSRLAGNQDLDPVRFAADQRNGHGDVDAQAEKLSIDRHGLIFNVHHGAGLTGLQRHQSHPLVGRQGSRSGRNRIAVGIVDGVTHPGSERLYVIFRQHMLGRLSKVVPIGR